MINQRYACFHRDRGFFRYPLVDKNFRGLKEASTSFIDGTLSKISREGNLHPPFSSQH